jgi:transcription elongation factor Elf1
MKSPLGQLTKEVDIYCEWIDIADELNNADHDKRENDGLGLTTSKKPQ